ncbi:MAG: type II toxin-antitoxin system HicB family antitoxin [Syntrophobacteraceae bacterium]|jgi:predicted RNase H-like HicB family nuclease
MMAKMVSFRQYVQEMLRSATYEACEDGNCIVAFVEALPGCITQGDTFEATRDLLIDAIETWILSALKDGDPLPVINDCKLAISEDGEEPEAVNA